MPSAKAELGGCGVRRRMPLALFANRVVDTALHFETGARTAMSARSEKQRARLLARPSVRIAGFARTWLSALLPGCLRLLRRPRTAGAEGGSFHQFGRRIETER